MAQYYDAEKVRNGNFKRVHSLGSEKPRFAHKLIGIFDRLIWDVCVDVSKDYNWQDFYQQYASGLFVNMELYDVPNDADISQ